MNNPFFSILIPCYNAQNGLNKAINSCLSQTFNDYEIILVDDKSQDKTIEILKDFNIDKFKYYINNNQKYGRLNTRSFLINKANGQYIIWLEPFDEISPDFLKNAYEEIIEKNYDIIEYSIIWRTNKENFDLGQLEETEYSNDNCLELYLSRNDAFQDLFYGKVIKAEILKNIKVPEYNTDIFDEMFFSLPMYHQVKNFSCKELPMYSYDCSYDRFAGSSEKTFENIKKQFQVKYKILLNNIDYLKEKNLFEKYGTAYLNKLHLYNLFENIINFQDKEKRIELLNEFYKYYFIHIGANL